ncbi:MAG: alpha-glucosidase [Treponema sp.]|jgi:oligo-1,6-glucosidase|nr:alpha-glucosidase [Treponema sp.]
MQWWKEGVIYQIYPRSFQDSNGDGIGDIPGIINRLPEIAALGVKAIWLSPVYRSPQIDNGYDVSDYRSIDPLFGTMEDMERLIAGAEKRGIRIIMDLVVNHTSDEHEWFRKSRRREEPYTDYYIWKPPGGRKKRPGAASGKNPPNNWTSFFMEDAWTFDEVRREYYLHLFHKKQPDLNYKNPLVLEEVQGILRFWLDKGVAGFRCDVINVLWKESLDDGKKSSMLTGLEHYKCREGNHDILRRLRKETLDPAGAFTVGETAMVDLAEAKLLSDEARRELDMVFYFDHLEVDRRFARFVPKKFRAAELLKRLAKWQQGLSWNAVYLENHDQSRIVSHYGCDAGAGQKDSPWERSAKILAALEFTLRGTPFIYQGQEMGMTNFDFTGFDQVKDIETHNFNRLLKKFHLPLWLRWRWLRLSSRDNARTPVQWSGRPGAGFTEGAGPPWRGSPWLGSPWLGINGNYRELNYETQRDDPGSVLSFYKRMIRLREQSETLKYGAFKPLLATGALLMYSREDDTPGGTGEAYVAAFNFSSRRVKLSGEGRVLLRGNVVISNLDKHGAYDLVPALEPWEALVVKAR